MRKDEIAVVDGRAFMVSDDLGEVLPGSAHGLFYNDTRFLSAYILKLNGASPVPLGSGNPSHRTAYFYATNSADGVVLGGTLSLVRERTINGHLRDELSLTNHGDLPASLGLSLRLGVDFADVFEVRRVETQRPPAIACTSVDGTTLEYRALRDGLECRTVIHCSERPTLWSDRLEFMLDLEPRQEWRLVVDVYATMTEMADHGQVATGGVNLVAGHWPLDAASLDVPRLYTTDPLLRRAWDRAVEDLAALRMPGGEGYPLPAAGLPWFMAVFGRDSLITGLQTLLLGPDLALGALHALAREQATVSDDFRDADPGKIPHEIRHGVLARAGHVPHACYYGTVDATPLSLVLLAETWRWTGDLELVRTLLPHAEAALTWIDRYGDSDGDGFVEYLRRSPHGLQNQGWKDSHDSVRFADGRLAEGAIALCEVQGYVYQGKLGMAELYDALDRRAEAAELRRQAKNLRRRFDEAFWMPDQDCYALALDGQKRQVDAVTSDAGQCLWSGIVLPKRARRLARRLMRDDLWSGWGIRTLSTEMAAYNPISYHNGSIWPHDTSLIAAGLARYGFREEANTIIQGLLAAAERFPSQRLPELFAGYPRRPNGSPIEYPNANAPQAWAAGAVVLMAQTLLGLEPSQRGLRSRPIGDPIALHAVPYQGELLDVGTGRRRMTRRTAV
jgi:glycogen debranching enzyme